MWGDTGGSGTRVEHDELLAEQVAYYRAVAPEYFDGQLDVPGGDELVAAIEDFAPRGDVLELAALGWDVRVRSTAGPFYWGAGTRAC